MTGNKRPRQAAGPLVWLLAPIGPAILVGYLIATFLGAPREGPPRYVNAEPRWHMEMTATGLVAVIDATPNRGPFPGPTIPGEGTRPENVLLFGSVAYVVLAATGIAFRRP